MVFELTLSKAILTASITPYDSNPRTLNRNHELFVRRHGLECTLKKPLKWFPVEVGAADPQPEGWGE